MKKLFIVPVIVLSCLLVGSSAFATTTDITSPVTGTILTSKPATFTGNTVTNGHINLQEDGTTIASTTADVNGDWSITTSNIKSGSHTYTAEAVFPPINIAFMNGQNGGVIDVVFVDNHDFASEIILPLDLMSIDLVTTNEHLYVQAYDMAEDSCYVLVYTFPEIVLESTISVSEDCGYGMIDVNSNETIAVVTYSDPSFTETHIAAIDLTNGSLIDDLTTQYSEIHGPRFSLDGTGIFTVVPGGLARFEIDNDTLVEADQGAYSQDNSAAIDIAPNGKVVIAELGLGHIRLINPNDLDDTSTIEISENVTNFSRLAVSHDGTKILVVGMEADVYHVWEVDVNSQTVVNEYDIDDYPESVGFTPDDSQYVIGDNFSSGTIFFGTPGGANYTHTIANPGASYAMRNTKFIAELYSNDISEPITTTNIYVAASYGTDPQGAIASKTVAPGDKVDVSGSGYQPNSDVTITLNSTPLLLATVKTNSSGTFSTKVTIPRNTSLGAHSLVIAGKDANGNAVSSVLSLSVVQIPATGNGAQSQTMLAVLLILGGYALVKSSRIKGLKLRLDNNA